MESTRYVYNMCAYTFRVLYNATICPTFIISQRKTLTPPAHRVINHKKYKTEEHTRPHTHTHAQHKRNENETRIAKNAERKTYVPRENHIFNTLR